MDLESGVGDLQMWKFADVQMEKIISFVGHSSQSYFFYTLPNILFAHSVNPRKHMVEIDGDLRGNIKGNGLIGSKRKFSNEFPFAIQSVGMYDSVNRIDNP